MGRITVLLAVYSLLFYLFLKYYYDIPDLFKKIRQPTYTFLEFTFFTLFVAQYIYNKKTKTILYSSLIFFFLFIVIYFMTAERQGIDSIPIGIESIIIFLFAFIYLRQFFKVNIQFYIYESPGFWIVVGVLIYLGTTFFFYILANQLTRSQFAQYWHFSYIPDIVKNLLFGMVILGYPSKNIEHKQINKPKDIPNLDMDMDMI